MAYFAKIGTDNTVEDIVVVHDDIATTEQNGIDFIHNLYNNQDTYVQTFRDGSSQRKNYAGVNISKYDSARDAFIFGKPFPSWVLNEDTCQWESPVPHPDSGMHTWNEDTQSWDARED